MKKIGLLLEAEPHFGGTFQYNQIILNALAELPRENFSVVVGYTSELWLEFIQSYDLRSLPVPRGFWGRGLCVAWMLCGLPMDLLRKISPAIHPMSKALLREKCDLWIFPSQDARGYQIPVPALISIADLMHRYERSFPESGSWWQYFIREQHYTNICKFAKGVLVDSEVGRQHVVESYGTALECVHALPFVAPKYIFHQGTPPDFDMRYRLPKKFIFYPAQFWEHKNHKRLIRAIAALRNEFSDLKLVLAGAKKNAYESVVSLVQTLGMENEVIFLGYVPDADMPELYRRARALVMPTFFGPTNIPTLEAFVTGCPVAISGTYGMPEQAGGAGLHFNPESVEEIADCIRQLWSDDVLCVELAGKGKIMAANWGQKQFNQRVLEIVTEITTVDGSSK